MYASKVVSFKSFYLLIYLLRGRRVTGISGTLISSKKNSDGTELYEVPRAQLVKSALLNSTLVPLGSFQIF